MIARIQEWTVWLDVGPLRVLFRAIYALGLRVVLSRLRNHPAVHSVYGCGSFFEGNSLHGHSDVDLIVVLREGVLRGNDAHWEVARRYRAVHRWFPFLGSWDEKEGSLVFLAEVAQGTPIAASLRLRLRTGALTHLCGDPFPLVIEPGPLRGTETTAEIATLIRVALLTGEPASARLLFWKRLFTKLARLAVHADVPDAAPTSRSRPELAFLAQSDRDCFFQTPDRETLFASFVDHANEIVDALRLRGELATRPIRGLDDQPAGDRPHELPENVASLLNGGDVTPFRAHALASLPFGLQPRLLYFPPDCAMAVVEFEEASYGELRRLLQVVIDRGEPDDAFLLKAGELVAILSRQEHYVELVPLDALRFPDLHACLEGRDEFEISKEVAEDLRAEATRIFGVLHRGYVKHDGVVPKQPYPCIYREEDLGVLADGLGIMRNYIAFVEDGPYLHDSVEIATWWKRRHPECSEFLDELVRSYRAQMGWQGLGVPANNVYRGLHQFLSGALVGAPVIEVDEANKTLPISVGIITRNRAKDLRSALESLTVQSRAPDEVVVVDNGSTDDTLDVIRSFEGRLPIRCVELPDASIPRARNLALETARGEVVAFTDDDVRCDPQWLESIERAFLRADNIGIVGGWVEHWPAEVPSTVDTYYATFHSNKA